MKNDLFKLYRLGMDPEFQLRNGTGRTIPADTVLCVGDSTGTSQYIGVDGCPTTGELRPPPCRNVNLLMAYLGDIMEKLNVLRQDQQFQSINAAPYSNGDPLGGHLHVSGFYPSQMNINEVYYTVLVAADALVGPLETMVQDYSSVARRRSSYGPHSDLRRQSSIPPHVPQGYAYFHIEYRLPSTFLRHPMVAYAYIAAFKTAMLNATSIRARLERLTRIHPWSARPGMELLEDADYTGRAGLIGSDNSPRTTLGILTERLQDLPLTRDCAHLPTVLQALYDNEAASTQVDFTAWATVAGKGKS